MIKVQFRYILDLKHMNGKNELCFCKVCAKETQHVLVLVRKENVFNDAKNSKKRILLLV